MKDARRGEEDALAPGRDLEAPEVVDEAARARAQEQDLIAVGSDLDIRGESEVEPVGRGVLLEESAVGVGEAAGRGRGARPSGRDEGERQDEDQPDQPVHDMIVNQVRGSVHRMWRA